MVMVVIMTFPFSMDQGSFLASRRTLSAANRFWRLEINIITRNNFLLRWDKAENKIRNKQSNQSSQRETKISLKDLISYHRLSWKVRKQFPNRFGPHWDPGRKRRLVQELLSRKSHNTSFPGYMNLCIINLDIIRNSLDIWQTRDYPTSWSVYIVYRC